MQSPPTPVVPPVPVVPAITKFSAVEYTMKALKESVTILSIFTLFVMFCGLLQMNIYYSYFGLQITDYISISELLVKMLNVLVTTGISLLVFTIMFVLQIFMNVSVEKPWKKAMYNMLFGFVGAIAVASLLFLVVPNTIGLLTPGFTLMAALIIYIVIIRKKNITRAAKNKLIYFLLMVCYGISIFISSILYAKISSREFYYSKKYHSTFVKFKSGKVIGKAENEFVIGVVESYVITYIDSIGQSAVYPKSDIETIQPGFLPQTFATSYRKTANNKNKEALDITFTMIFTELKDLFSQAFRKEPERKQ